MTRRGWVYGTTTGGEWLTIPGSASRLDLADSPDKAAPFPEDIVLDGRTPLLALVEDCGHPFYRILATAEEAR